MPKRARLIRVVAPHFVAVLDIWKGRVVFAAPILAWTVGKKDTEVFAYFERKGWVWQKLSRGVRGEKVQTSKDSKTVHRKRSDKDAGRKSASSQSAKV